MRRKFLAILTCVSVLLSFLACLHSVISAQSETNVSNSGSPTIQDFYINNTYSGLATQFSFVCSDSVALAVGILQTNVTGSAANTTLSLSGTQAWANYTIEYPGGDSLINFDFWVNDSDNLWATTGNRTVNVYDYTNPGTVSYFNSLSQAITAVQGANDFNDVSPYLAYILSENQTSMQTMIDNYAATQQWLDVLEWSAICNKLWYNSIPIDVESDINYAIGNATMVGCLPWTGDTYFEENLFGVESEWSLYGYYYAAQSWALAYNPSSVDKWNITASYNQFDTAVNYSVSEAQSPFCSGLPLQIDANAHGMSFANRYYDEDANTIGCYLLFYTLLNVSDALNKAVYWWNYDVSTHWNSTNDYFQYTPSLAYFECEEPFFLKIASMLKYYCVSLDNWTYVLEDLCNRFLSSEWMSPQWVDSSDDITTYAVVHAFPTNPQRRLENTLAAWQVLQGVYPCLESGSQSNIRDMLSGNQNLQPAWALSLSQYNFFQQENGAGLYDATTNMFSEGQPANSDYGTFADDPTATAQAEILLFILGIVPEGTTIAFQLEQLNYEYIQDINPEIFQFNLSARSITVPIDHAGTMTFQYGESPLSYNFTQRGDWKITFTKSWNTIANVTCVTYLPTSSIYFSQIENAPYNVTINARCVNEDVDLNVSVMLDGSSTSYTSPCTFIDLTGIHNFTVSTTDLNGRNFSEWSTLEPTSTITVWDSGTYTAYYEAPRAVVATLINTNNTWIYRGRFLNITVSVLNLESLAENASVTLYYDISSNLSINTYAANLDTAQSYALPFAWNTAGVPCGTYMLTAVVRTISGSNTFTGGNVTVRLLGDVNGDGRVDLRDIALVARAFGSTPTSPNWNPAADISGDGVVNMQDITIVARHFGEQTT